MIRLHFADVEWKSDPSRSFTVNTPSIRCVFTPEVLEAFVMIIRRFCMDNEFLTDYFRCDNDSGSVLLASS